jgi:hypothetical protein
VSLSDCEKCWDTPCTCGYQYRRWETKRIADLRDVLQAIIDHRTTQPRCHEPLPYGGTCEDEAGHQGRCIGAGAKLSPAAAAKVDWGASIALPMSAIEGKKP